MSISHESTSYMESCLDLSVSLSAENYWEVPFILCFRNVLSQLTILGHVIFEGLEYFSFILCIQYTPWIQVGLIIEML